MNNLYRYFFGTRLLHVRVLYSMSLIKQYGKTMLRLSRLTDYGILVMVYLAKHQKQVCNVKTIALAVHLSVPTVGKLLKLLAKAKLLLSHRGLKGGYCLPRPANDISLGEIIRALETRQGLTQCSAHQEICSLALSCENSHSWWVLNQYIELFLLHLSLAEFSDVKLLTAKCQAMLTEGEEPVMIDGDV